MTTIHKFPLTFDYNPEGEKDAVTVQMPHYADILRVGYDGRHDICLWAMVNTEHPMERRRFQIRGTGMEIDAENNRVEYVGSVEETISSSWFVWHIVELISH